MMTISRVVQFDGWLFLLQSGAVFWRAIWMLSRSFVDTREAGEFVSHQLAVVVAICALVQC
jgi:hypothetical protein